MVREQWNTTTSLRIDDKWTPSSRRIDSAGCFFKLVTFLNMFAVRYGKAFREEG